MLAIQPPRTIAVNTRFLLADRLEGIGIFSQQILQRVVQQHPQHRFIFLFDRPYDEQFLFADNVTPCVVQPPARHPFLWYAWFEWGVPAALRRCQADAFLSLDGYCSLATTVPTLMVIHDLAFEHYPQQVPFLARHYYRHFSPRYARRANRIVTVSDYTKTDLADRYHIDPQKITVAHNGVSQQYQALSNEQQVAVRKQYAQGSPFFLFVGAIHPRKNLANILRAFDRFKYQNIDSPIKMMIAGRRAWHSREAFEVYEAMAFKHEVIFVGHLAAAELCRLTASALALVYASFFEGFGIPIIEAMQCGTAVITSNVSSMPEVAGKAALLVNPHEPAHIAAAMQQLYHEPQLRQQLITAGLQQCTQFNWQQSSERLWQATQQLWA